MCESAQGSRGIAGCRAIGQTKNADQAVAFAAINDIMKKGKVTKSELGTEAKVHTAAMLNGNAHTVEVFLQKQTDTDWNVAGIAVDGENIYDASQYANENLTDAKNQFEGEEATDIDLEDKEDYPYNMQTVIQEYIDSTNNQILEYAEKCRLDKNVPYERIPITPISDRQAADAERLLGIDFSGYNNALEKSALIHIEKRHGVKGEQDTSMKDLNDVARIGYILENYDNVEVTTDNDGNDRYSKQFRDKNNRPAPMLRFSKKINGTYYAVIAFPDARYKKLWLVSAYIGKK